MINYTSKQNERLIGQAIVNEAHTIGIIAVATIASGLIRLVEVPQAPAPLSTVSIPGYTEITIGSPTGTQFLVDYTTGVILFNVSQDGNAILVSYIGLGSEIAAEDINELQGPVGVALNLNGSLTNNIVKPASISNTVTDDFIFPRDITANRDVIATTKTITDLVKSRTGNLLLEPLSNSITGIRLANATGTVILDVDTTNLRVGINNSAPTVALDVTGSVIVSGTGLIGGTSIDPSAILDLQSTTKGFLSPRMTTTQRNAISSPATGLEIYNTTTGQQEYYNGVSWVASAGSPASGVLGSIQFSDGAGTLISDGANFFWDDSTNRLGIGTNTPLVSLDVAGKAIITNTTPSTDALVITNTTPSQGLLVNGKIVGRRDNGTSLAVRGLQDPSEGVAVVSSYSGIFFNSGYNTTGTLKTRFITGANVEMDMELQSPHQLRLIAGDNSTTDANVYMVSNTIVGIHARAEQEAVDAHYLIVDRVDTSTRGLFNTSEMVLKTNSGSLYLNYGITTGAIVLPSLTTAQQNALTPVAGMVIFNATTNQAVLYNGSAWVVMG